MSAEALVEGGGKAKGFSQVCVCDAKSLLGPLWDDFQSFIEKEAAGDLSTTVACGNGPAVLVRQVDPGENKWPVLQEGRR